MTGSEVQGAPVAASYGAEGQDGSGVHPGDGVQSDGIVQLGGGLNRTVLAYGIAEVMAIPGKERRCFRSIHVTSSRGWWFTCRYVSFR